jgi:transcriptional regulator with XRE-family HTH domain
MPRTYHNLALTPEYAARLRTNVRRAFSMTIRDLRLLKGVAQETLALEAEVDRGYMGTLERGESTPTLDTIFKLLPQLDIDFVQFAALFEVNLKRARRKRH